MPIYYTYCSKGCGAKWPTGDTQAYYAHIATCFTHPWNKKMNKKK